MAMAIAIACQARSHQVLPEADGTDLTPIPPVHHPTGPWVHVEAVDAKSRFSSASEGWRNKSKQDSKGQFFRVSLVFPGVEPEFDAPGADPDMHHMAVGLLDCISYHFVASRCFMLLLAVTIICCVCCLAGTVGSFGAPMARRRDGGKTSGRYRARSSDPKPTLKDDTYYTLLYEDILGINQFNSYVPNE